MKTTPRLEKAMAEMLAAIKDASDGVEEDMRLEHLIVFWDRSDNKIISLTTCEERWEMLQLLNSLKKRVRSGDWSKDRQKMDFQAEEAKKNRRRMN